MGKLPFNKTVRDFLEEYIQEKLTTLRHGEEIPQEEIKEFMNKMLSDFAAIQTFKKAEYGLGFWLYLFEQWVTYIHQAHNLMERKKAEEAKKALQQGEEKTVSQ